MDRLLSSSMYMTQYSEFIKDWAQRNNKSYMCAATDPRAREEYYGSYPKRPTKSKLKQMREKQSAAVMELMDMGAKAKADMKDTQMREKQSAAVAGLMEAGVKAKRTAEEASKKADMKERAKVRKLKKITEAAAKPAAAKDNKNKQILEEWFGKLFSDKSLLNVDGDLFFDSGYTEVFVSKKNKSGRGAVSAKEIIEFISSQTTPFTQEDVFKKLGSDERYFIDDLLSGKKLRVMDRYEDNYRSISRPNIEVKLYKN